MRDYARDDKGDFLRDFGRDRPRGYGSSSDGSNGSWLIRQSERAVLATAGSTSGSAAVPQAASAARRRRAARSSTDWAGSNRTDTGIISDLRRADPAARATARAGLAASPPSYTRRPDPGRVSLPPTPRCHTADSGVPFDGDDHLAASGSAVKIRSICVGLDAAWPLDLAAVRRAGGFLRRAAERFADAGIEVQTTRIATSPFAEAGPPDDAAWVIPFATALERACQDVGVGFTSIGPVRWGVVGPATGRRYAAALGEVLVGTSQINGTIETVAGGRPSGGAALAAGAIVRRLAAETPLGFGNFRFCTIAHCAPNIPFFPAAYHGGGPLRFAVGLQAAADVRAAFADPGTLDDLEGRLAATLGAEIARVEAIARDLAAEHGVAYAGTDLTPAPFPADADSAAGMLEDLAGAAFGSAGTLAAAAALTAMLKRLPFAHVGYSGLMLPVLEDAVLALRASAGLASVPELLLYSAVCGTGLDTVPLPGDASAEELAAIILDVAALAAALQKPLSCRLFPVPGRSAGDRTAYDSPYLVNGTVLALKGQASPRLFERFGA